MQSETANGIKELLTEIRDISLTSLLHSNRAQWAALQLQRRAFSSGATKSLSCHSQLFALALRARERLRTMVLAVTPSAADQAASSTDFTH